MSCASFTWCCEVLSIIGMNTHVIWPWFGASFWGFFHSILLTSIGVLALTSHARAMLSNPGAVPSNAKPVDPAHYDRHCHKCNNFKPLRAHHCSVCGRCVIKMDHHCPWVNTCVGVANHKYFLLFVMYIMTTCLYSGVLIFFRFIACMSPTSVCDVPAGDAAVIIAMTLFAILFGLFTGCLFVDQLNSVFTGTTQIDRMKGYGPHGQRDANERKQFWDNISEVVGGDPYKDGFSIHWLIPTAVKFRDPEGLTGYCFRDVPRPRTAAEMEMV